MNDKSKLALAFVLGAAAGAAIAYFLTTEQGEKTVEDLKEAATKFKDNLDEKLEKSKQAVHDIADTAERIINNLNQQKS